MNQINQTIVCGNIVRDPELKTLASGTKTTTVSIAMNRNYRASNGEIVEETSFIDVELFGKNAENTVKYCKKGKEVQIVGRLRQERWTDADGKKHSKIVIVAEYIEFRADPKATSQTTPTEKVQTVAEPDTFNSEEDMVF